jgi:hypothetical protein
MIKLRDLLTEGDTIVKNKKTGNVYSVKTFNPAIHNKPTAADIQTTKAKNGGKIPKDPTATPQNLQKLAQLKQQVAAPKGDKKLNKLLNKHGITKDLAQKASDEATKLAASVSKGKAPKDINPGDGKDMVDSIKDSKLNQDGTTKELTSKLQKSPYGKFVKDDKNDNMTFFFYDGSKYKMHIDRKNKSITTKSIKENTIKLKDLLKEVSFLDNFKKVNSGYNPKKIIADFSKESGTDLADKNDREDHKRYVKDMIAWFDKMDKKGPTVKVGDLVNVNMRTMRRTGIGKIVKAVEMQGSFGFMGQAAPDKQPAWKIDCYTERNIGTSKQPIECTKETLITIKEHCIIHNMKKVIKPLSQN